MRTGAELEKFLRLLGRCFLVPLIIITPPPPSHILLPYFQRALVTGPWGLRRTMVINAKGSRSSFLPAWAGVCVEGVFWSMPPHLQMAVLFTCFATCFVILIPTLSPVCLLPPSHPPLSPPSLPSALAQAPGQGVRVLVAQSCPTLCNPVDCSLPGSSVQGILQARVLEWGYHSLLQGNLPNPGTEPRSPVLQQILYCLSLPGQDSP